MKKSIFDHYSWACAYSLYHPVFYSFVKTNYTPAHVSAWPIKKIYTRKQEPVRLVNQRQVGDLHSFQVSQEYPKIIPQGKSRRILLKRFSTRKDVNAVVKLLSDCGVSSDDYYLLAATMMNEGSITELMVLIEKGLETEVAPTVGLLGDIMEKAVQEKDYKSCRRIWEILCFLERDAKVEKSVLLFLTVINDDKELFKVYRKALEWNVLTIKIQRGILECARRISCPYLKDWAFRFNRNNNLQNSSEARVIIKK
jgi:hypothetical protein